MARSTRAGGAGGAIWACLAGAGLIASCGLTHDLDQFEATSDQAAAAGGQGGAPGEGGAGLAGGSAGKGSGATGGGASATQSSSATVSTGSGTCGYESGPCCGGVGCNSGDLACIGGICQLCGLSGKPCCAGACAAASTVCDAGTCVPCGAAGEPCCPSAPICTGNQQCVMGFCEKCCAKCAGAATWYLIDASDAASCFADAHDKCLSVHGCSTGTPDVCCPNSCYFDSGWYDQCP